MTPGPIDILSDSGTQDSVPEDLSAEHLQKLAEAPASELSVMLGIRHHATNCWAKKLRVWLVFVAGVLFAGQIAVGVIVKVSLAAARAEIHEAIRQGVEQVLRERKIIGSTKQDAPNWIAAYRGSSTLYAGSPVQR